MTNELPYGSRDNERKFWEQYHAASAQPPRSDTGLPEGVRYDGPIDTTGTRLQFTDYAEGPACGGTFTVASRHADFAGILTELLTMRKRFESRSDANYPPMEIRDLVVENPNGENEEPPARDDPPGSYRGGMFPRTPEQETEYRAEIKGDRMRDEEGDR